MKRGKFIIFCILLIFSDILPALSQRYHALKFKNVPQTRAYYHYTGNGYFIICGHRGGAIAGFPENCIPTLEHTLEATTAMFEVDPHLTKDHKTVMIHDATLDRVTNGKGKVKDYTLAQLEKLYLKDPTGKVTSYQLNTMPEIINWAKSRTVVKLDVKDVPLKMKAEDVRKADAFNYIIFATHNLKQSNFFYHYDSRCLIAPKMKSLKAFNAYDESDISWSHILFCYIGPRVNAKTKALRDSLHQRGVMVMISAATSYDTLSSKKERTRKYRNVIKQDFDILESNRPIEVAKAVKDLYPQKSRKFFYWRNQELK